MIQQNLLQLKQRLKDLRMARLTQDLLQAIGGVSKLSHVLTNFSTFF